MWRGKHSRRSGVGITGRSVIGAFSVARRTDRFAVSRVNRGVTQVSGEHVLWPV
jgi:hypothetical protein